MLRVEEFRCPYCSAPLRVTPESLFVACSYCGNVTYLNKRVIGKIFVIPPRDLEEVLEEAHREALKSAKSPPGEVIYLLVDPKSAYKTLEKALRERRIVRAYGVLFPVACIVNSLEVEAGFEIHVNEKVREYVSLDEAVKYVNDAINRLKKKTYRGLELSWNTSVSDGAVSVTFKGKGDFLAESQPLRYSEISWSKYISAIAAMHLAEAIPIGKFDWKKFKEVRILAPQKYPEVKKTISENEVKGTVDASIDRALRRVKSAIEEIIARNYGRKHGLLPEKMSTFDYMMQIGKVIKTVKRSVGKLVESRKGDIKVKVEADYRIVLVPVWIVTLLSRGSYYLTLCVDGIYGKILWFDAIFTAVKTLRLLVTAVIGSVLAFFTMPFVKLAHTAICLAVEGKLLSALTKLIAFTASSFNPLIFLGLFTAGSLFFIILEALLGSLGKGTLKLIAYWALVSLMASSLFLTGMLFTGIFTLAIGILCIGLIGFLAEPLVAAQTGRIELGRFRS